jgi:hypothetical protein
MTDLSYIIVKAIIALGLGMYTVFALVVIRQVSLMTQTVKTGLEMELKILSWLHLMFAVGVLLYTLLLV